ncbi:MAG: Ig-like domain-containing protein [Candidatus Marinimicrobia bacterium]|nr:Ig-like domain-containing protein [Candidatus Neomarinimicrobiota bacterium]
MKPLISIISIFIFLSCAAQAPATGGPKDVYGPELISVLPADASTHLKMNTKIIFEFDESVDPTSIKSSISIVGFEEFSVKSRRNKITIEPNSAWPENEVIEINMSRRIRDYQNNTMSQGHQFVFSRGASISAGSITGKLENYHPEKITNLLLFEWPLSDSSQVVKTVEADSEGAFEFLYLPSNKYIIFATEGRSIDPSLAIFQSRYGMIQSNYIPIDGDQNQNIHIYMDEPIQNKKIVSINQVNPQFGFINFSDGTEGEILFSDCENCIFDGDTLMLFYEVENRLEKYTIGPQSFLFEAKLDTISPTLLSKYWDDEGYSLQFSEPIQLSDSLNFESQIDSAWNSISFSIVDNRDIVLSISEDEKIRFWGPYITDLYNNQFQDSLVEMSVTKKTAPTVETISGGNVSGSISYKFMNEIVVKAESISSAKSTFVVSTNGKFEFNNLEPGKYVLKAFENKTEINSENYFSGVWNPYNAAATYAIYADTLDVRSRWDIEDVNFKIENFLQE